MSPSPRDPSILWKHVLGDLQRMHALKSAAYGDSWRKHGEQLSVMANITRKVDRLQIQRNTPDERRIDTVADLAVYALLYNLWLLENPPEPTPPHTFATEQEGVEYVAANLAELLLVSKSRAWSYEACENVWNTSYTLLEDIVLNRATVEISEQGVYLVKRLACQRMAIVCVRWLCLYLLDHSEEYTTWAHQWNEND